MSIARVAWLVLLSLVAGRAIAEPEGPFGDKEWVLEAAYQHRDAIDACYNAALADTPTLAGRVLVTWRVLASGTVEDAKIEESSAGSPKLERCIRDEVARWTFAPRAAPTRAWFPFFFQPKSQAVQKLPDGAEIKGSLDKEVVRRVIRRHLLEVQDCYEKGLARHPELAGRVMIQFTISGKGEVIASVVQSSDLGDKIVERCITDRMRKWEFPAPTGGGIVIVSYPFVLKSEPRTNR